MCIHLGCRTRIPVSNAVTAMEVRLVICLLLFIIVDLIVYFLSIIKHLLKSVISGMALGLYAPRLPLPSRVSAK